MFMKKDPIIYAVPKPRDVDSLLDHGMLVWVMGVLTRTKFLHDGQ